MQLPDASMELRRVRAATYDADTDSERFGNGDAIRAIRVSAARFVCAGRDNAAQIPRLQPAR